MLKALRHAIRLLANRRGATVLEFGLIAPIFTMMLLGGMDVGYGIYVRTVATGTLEAVARKASVEGATEAQTDAMIAAAMNDVMPNYFDPATHMAITKKSYVDFRRVGKAEPIVLDANANGTINPGDCWLDEDEDGTFGINSGKQGMGGADDATYYGVDLQFPRLFPVAKLIGLPADQTIKLKTVIVNQPYGIQAVPPTVCAP